MDRRNFIGTLWAATCAAIVGKSAASDDDDDYQYELWTEGADDWAAYSFDDDQWSRVEIGYSEPRLQSPLVLPWQSVRFTKLELLDGNPEILDIEFWVVDAMLDLHLCAYVNQGAYLHDVPVKVVGLNGKDTFAKCLRADLVFTPYEVGPSPTLFAMYLQYVGDVDGA